MVFEKNLVTCNLFTVCLRNYLKKYRNLSLKSNKCIKFSSKKISREKYLCKMSKTYLWFLKKFSFKKIPMAKSTHKKVTNPSSQVGMSYFSQSKQYSFPGTVTFEPSELRHFVKFPAGASFFQQISKPCSSRTGIENTILKSGRFERINDLHKLTFANKRD